ncbi:hypothetical protein C8Q74DRAFT_207961 [Fomes fomentarius]|nr:hypothetical protein C8Q74DRAFT_207961 [Fomes fomentarius]
MASPNIRISTPSRCSTRDDYEQDSGHSGDAYHPSPPPPPSPASSPKDSLNAPPNHNRTDSSASLASTATLTSSQQDLDAPRGTITGERLTAEPAQIVGKPNGTPDVAFDVPQSQPLKQDKTVYLAPIPVRYVSKNRYSSRQLLDKNGSDWEKYKMLPVRNRISPRSKAAGRWQPCVHPEGQLYFQFENFYTNVYLYDDLNLKYIDETVSLVKTQIREDYPDLAMDHIEIGLDLMDDEDDPDDQLGCYYLVDMVEAEVFWMEEVVEGFLNDLDDFSILSREHLKIAARRDYWQHVGMFPHGRSFSPEAFAELEAELNYWMLDIQMSPTSTVPYATEELYRFLQILSHVRFQSGKTPVPNVMILAQLNNSLMHERFIRYHGERYAQLDNNRSVHESTMPEYSAWFKAVTWLFFYTPHLYAERLHLIYLDKKVNYQVWRRFIAELREDWENSITPATVVLTANVGFLAIQSVDQAGAFRSAGQIVSYMSLVLSIGNVFACHILSRILHQSLHHTATDALQYLVPRMETHYGRERLAIVLSIPTSFFLWALFTFFISITWLCFNATGLATRLVTGSTIVVSAICLGTVIHTGRGFPKGYGAIVEHLKKTKVLVKKVKKAPKKMREIGKKARSMSIDAVSALSPRQRALRKSYGSLGGSTLYVDDELECDVTPAGEGVEWVEIRRRTVEALV